MSDRAQDQADEQHRPVGLGGEDRLLGDEAEQRRHARHRGGGERGDDRQHRCPTTETGEFPQVTGADFVVDEADHEKQRRLEQGVGQQHRDPGECGVRAARADHHGQQAELADRAVGQQQLEVALAQRRPAADEHGDQAEGEQHGTPRAGVGEHRGEQTDQVDAGLDHRRRVQVGADRGGRGHRHRQPAVERHDRRLGQRAGQDQQHRGDQRPAAGQRCGGDLRPAVGAGVSTEDQEAEQHGQPAQRGDGQRLGRRPPAGAALGAVPDEQVGEDCGEFPEDVEQQQVVGEDQAEHRAGEGDQHGDEPGQAHRVGREVPAAVDQHQRADPADQQGHQPGQRRHPQRHVEVQLTDPVVRLDDRAAVAHRPGAGQRPAERGGGHQRERVAGARTPPPDQQWREERRQQVEEQQYEHASSRRTGGAHRGNRPGPHRSHASSAPYGGFSGNRRQPGGASPPGSAGVSARRGSTSRSGRPSWRATLSTTRWATASDRTGSSLPRLSRRSTK